MKIALPTDDGLNLSAHFGRCAAFAVFEVADGQIKARELRSNAADHNHAGFANILHDCALVLCGGIGAGAAQALHSAGLQIKRTEPGVATEQAVLAYLKGELAAPSANPCQCSHHH